ncbi:glycosyl hydrolase 108 family protein [Brevundimonas sp. RM1]
MARGPFPTGDFGRRVSDAPIGMDIGAPAAGAAAGVAEAAKGVARELGAMADRSLKREGERDAGRAITAAGQFGQEVQLRQGFGVDDQAFNAIAREYLSTRRISAYAEEIDKAELASPDSEAGFTEARGAVRQAFRDRATGDPLIDAEFERQATLLDQAALRRVRVGQEKARISMARGAMTEAASVGETLIGQAVASAGFDDAGATLIAANLTEYTAKMARFGPREAFSIGGVEFAADPNRSAAMSVEELARHLDQVQARTRSTWLTTAVDQAPDAASARAMAGQIEEQWAAGNPAFVGLSASDFAQVAARNEATVNRKANGEGAGQRAAGQQLRDMMTAAEYGGDYDVGQMRALAQASGDPGLVAMVEFGERHGFGVTPASLRSGGRPVGGGFDGWVDFLLDDLEGEGFVGNDNGAGRAQWGITERSHPEAWADGRIDRNEARTIYRQYWADVGGDNLPPALAHAAASAAVVAGAGNARRWLAASGGDVERFHDLQLAHFEKLAADNPAKYGGSLNGWRRRDGLSRAQSRRVTASERAAEGYASDPIGFARGNSKRDAMVELPEFDINRIFGGDPSAGGFLRDRLAVGRQLNARSGVPVAVFDKAELATIKDRIEADPAAVVGLVQTAAQTPGVGSDGVRVILGQLGMAGTASADLHLGWLATDDHTRNIAAKVIQGRALRASGAKDADFGRGEETIAQAALRFAPAFAMQPDLFAVAQATARDMAIADQARGQLQSAEAYVNSALGGTRANGRLYGGLARVNGANTIAPTWLASDYLDDALEIAADLWAAQDVGPVYSNGQPIPARTLRNYRLKATPSGTYRLVNTAGEELPARSGRPFEFNIEADSFRDVLRRRLPGAVLGSR